jgi:hypothetical protein
MPSSLGYGGSAVRRLSPVSMTIFSPERVEFTDGFRRGGFDGIG